jgi:hypothetical protein
MAWWMFGLVFLVLGVIFLIVGLVATKRAKAAQSWPSMPGTVMRSEVVRHESTDEDGSSSVTFEPVVEYSFSVMGQPFTGKRIAFGANRFNHNKAVEITARYPIGARPNVYYNPDKPKDSVLETSASGGKLFVILGGVFSAVGLVALIISLLA